MATHLTNLWRSALSLEDITDATLIREHTEPRGQVTRTNGSDDRGSKDDRIGPVPVVEGLVPCNGDPLASSL
ncbi:hypothetical protein JZ751_003189 [Albula glossodonta]|uniref:Uncharacterized protein n=1 Tax=Albula glossodonta TaxID=121402 RepID=A0A8T2NDC8_9TELE|nr:hypothetical protein JZ751_003189 [Albula glossodonta]